MKEFNFSGDKRITLSSKIKLLEDNEEIGKEGDVLEVSLFLLDLFEEGMISNITSPEGSAVFYDKKDLILELNKIDYKYII